MGRAEPFEFRASRNDARGIHARVALVVVALDVVEVAGIGDVGQLVELPNVAAQMLVVDDPTEVTLEVDVVHWIETKKTFSIPSYLYL